MSNYQLVKIPIQEYHSELNKCKEYINTLIYRILNETFDASIPPLRFSVGLKVSLDSILRVFTAVLLYNESRNEVYTLSRIVHQFTPKEKNGSVCICGGIFNGCNTSGHHIDLKTPKELVILIYETLKDIRPPPIPPPITTTYSLLPHERPPSSLWHKFTDIITEGEEEELSPSKFFVQDEFSGLFKYNTHEISLKEFIQDKDEFEKMQNFIRTSLEIGVQLVDQNYKITGIRHHKPTNGAHLDCYCMGYWCHPANEKERIPILENTRMLRTMLIGIYLYRQTYHITEREYFTTTTEGEEEEEMMNGTELDQEFPLFLDLYH